MTDFLTFRKNVNTQHVFEFLLCLADIADAGNEVKNTDKRNVFVRAIASARRISVALRKLLLDGNGFLIKSCLADPKLHRLRQTDLGTQPISFIQSFKRPSMTLGWADGSKATIEIPEYKQRTTIHPLYGIRHSRGQEFNLEMPFDYNSDPLRLGRWMNTKVLEVDGTVFSAEDLLREMANNEGAHIGESIKFALPDASTKSIVGQTNERYKTVNTVKFGGFSYIQLFCMWTGLYLSHRCKELLDHLPTEYDNNPATLDVCERIRQGPKELSGRVKVENQTYHGMIIGSDNKLSKESIGDYSTFLRIP